MVSVEPGQSRGSTETMLSWRSFGSRVVPEVGAEERSRQNELVHFSQVRFCRNVPRLCLWYAADANPLFPLIFRVVPQRSEERSRHSLGNKDVTRLARRERLNPADFIKNYMRTDEDNDLVFNKMPCPVTVLLLSLRWKN